MTDDRLRHFVKELRAEASLADFADIADPAVQRGSNRSPLLLLRTRLAAAVTTAFVSIGGFGGLAYAADGAAPGDFLYGIDRALEAVGIGGGGADERLEEVRDLVGRGHVERGLDHAAESVVTDTAAQQALRAAADRLAGSDTPSVAHQDVATLLTYLADNKGSIDGQKVAELARSVGNGPPEGVTPGPPEGVTPGPPEGVTPGPPEGVTPGPPEGVTPGLPECVTPGPPEGQTTGPPDGQTTGPPEGVTPGPPDCIAADPAADEHPGRGLSKGLDKAQGNSRGSGRDD